MIGGKQLGFTDYEQTTATKHAKCEKFLDEMKQVVPWQALLPLIEPVYPKASSRVGCPPYPLDNMLSINLKKKWYSLRYPAR